MVGSDCIPYWDSTVPLLEKDELLHFFRVNFFGWKKMGRIFWTPYATWRGDERHWLCSKGLDVNTINTMKSLDSVIGARNAKPASLPFWPRQLSHRFKPTVILPHGVCVCVFMSICGFWVDGNHPCFFLGVTDVACYCLWFFGWCLPQASRYRMHVTQFLLQKKMQNKSCALGCPWKWS